MENPNALKNPSTRRILPIACITALAVAFTAAAARPAHADRVIAPRVPANLQVSAGNKVFLEGHATGTQDYVCLPSGGSFAWTFFGPQATLVDDDRKQIITHFLSSNPVEGGTPRATWQSSFDTSAARAKMAPNGSTTDPNFVAAGAIPWLLLEVVGTQLGPNGGDALAQTAFVQRLNTSGGVAPAGGCSQAENVGTLALVPYTADYFFYKAAQPK